MENCKLGRGKNVKFGEAIFLSSVAYFFPSVAIKGPKTNICSTMMMAMTIIAFVGKKKRIAQLTLPNNALHVSAAKKRP